MTEQSNIQSDVASDRISVEGALDRNSSTALNAEVQQAGEALLKLGASDPELAGTLARVLGVVASEAARTSRFSKALSKALANPEPPVASRPSERPRRLSRRSPGAIEPFAIFAESGEAGLRSRLKELSLEQLRDIIAEHGMDHDRLAMKWKDPQRVIDRIVERVESRVTKGSAFRGRPSQHTAPQGESGPEKGDPSSP
ncbi:hypothetical protein QA943_23600 [Streptomyces sp. B21-097]|uniref:hypothetical protein n=1 Tax=Streptomyces sp. B21-097 TaxID=3039414 RepID=UPI002FEF118F